MAEPDVFFATRGDHPEIDDSPLPFRQRAVQHTIGTELVAEIN